MEDLRSATGVAMRMWKKKLKNDLNVTIRCIPLEATAEEGKCVISGRPSQRRVIFAKSY